MTFPTNIDLHTSYEDDAPAAQERVPAAKLDADHLELERWLNSVLLPALAQILREDGTLTDQLVRYRNLHPEVFASLGEAVGSVPLAVPADGSVGTTKLALLAVTAAILADNAVTTAKIQDAAVTAAKISDTADALQAAIGISAAMRPVVQGTVDNARDTLAPFDESHLAFSDVLTGNADDTKHGLMPKITAALAALFDGGFALRRSDTDVNETVPVHSLEAAGAGDRDIALIPSGSGSLLAAIPDNAASGGNKRGVRAVDLQMQRFAADQVASGEGSVLIGGSQNLVMGWYSSVVGGKLCMVSGLHAWACGDTAKCNRNYAQVHGAFGGAEYAAGSGCQSENLLLKAETADATATTLVDGSYNRSILMEYEQVVMFVAQVVGYQAGATPNAAGYVIEGTAKKGVGAGSTVLVGSPVVRAQENNAAWDVTVTVTDDGGTDSGININVVGAAGVTVHWVARVSVIKMRRSVL